MRARLPISVALLLATSLAGRAGDALEDLLARAGLRQADLCFPLLPAERDSFRLARVDEVLKDGRRLDHWADSLGSRLARAERLGELAASLLSELGRAGHAPLALEESPLPAGGTRSWSQWTDFLGGLGSRRLLEPDAVQTLEQDLGDLLQEDESQGGLSVFELDSLERLSEVESLLRMKRLERTPLPEPRDLLDLLAELDRFFLDLSFFKAAAAGERVVEDARYGTVLYADERVVVGADGPNHWQGELPPVIIDLGGDDLYEGPVAVSRGGVALVIDLGGDDRYRSRGEPGPAATVGGLALLLDLAGNDRYEGDYHALGAALGGLALLVDQDGDDHYSCDTFGQGAGSLGVGALVDGGGNDLYLCSLYGQGFGHVAGLGLLQDLTGHDHYLMQPRYVDQIRYDDHHLTMGQGFGFGRRPELSGGIGLLQDLEGNDLYSADIFGQGGAYWWALGALLDHAGNDRYLAWQYAQGAGVHLAAGLLADDAGLDVYQSRGVSQGCGHDLALGWLKDLAGDDSYEAWDLSQGGGNANGAGLLTDLGGDDLYAMRGPGKPRPYGDPRRRTGSLGLFLDAAGRDFYLGGGANDTLWTGSQRALGQDWGLRVEATLATDTSPATLVSAATAPAPPASGAPAAGLDPLFRADDPPARLYVWAIRLEPKWARERDAARRELAARPDEFATLVRGRRLMASEISWERHALKELVTALGPRALPLLEEAVSAPAASGDSLEARRRRTERSFALWTFSEAPALGAASFFTDAWSAGLGRDEPGAAALLLECLAGRGGPSAPLLEGLADPRAGVRRSAAWGLGQLPASETGREALLAALGDSLLVVRMSAFESLARDTLLAPVRLERILWATAAPLAQRREVLRLLARRDPAACRALLPRLQQEPGLRGELAWLVDGLPPAAAAPAGRRAPRRARP